MGKNKHHLYDLQYLYTSTFCPWLLMGSWEKKVISDLWDSSDLICLKISIYWKIINFEMLQFETKQIIICLAKGGRFLYMYYVYGVIHPLRCVTVWGVTSKQKKWKWKSVREEGGFENGLKWRYVTVGWSLGMFLLLNSSQL